jgi:hypothetical protein
MKYISATELHRKSGVPEQSFVTVAASPVPPNAFAPPKI